MADKKYTPGKGQNEGGFGKFLWNPETSEFLGRTGASWFKITVFYIIFFAGLAAFFMLMLYIFLATIDPNRPKWEGSSGLIGDNPGVGFRPMPDQDKNVESTLIWYKRNKADSYDYWVKELNNTLKEYQNQAQVSGSANGINCKESGKADENKWCRMEINEIDGACSANNEYGYRLGEPCILIKLNRIYGWKPEPYKQGDSLPDDMPASVRTKIQDTPKEHIWFSCEGENPADRENLGPLTYYPEQGIPTHFFPYLKQGGYQSPFIFVRLSKPVNNVLINVECKAWAKNIHPSRLDRVGAVHFEVMID